MMISVMCEVWEHRLLITTIISVAENGAWEGFSVEKLRGNSAMVEWKEGEIPLMGNLQG